MPSYFFDLTTDNGLVHDAEGTDLRDDAEAGEHARFVALELMRGREAETQAWQLDVYDVARRRCLELPFGDADETPSSIADVKITSSGACGIEGNVLVAGSSARRRGS